MKKIIFLFAIMMVAVMTSCSGGYDQKKVDEIEKKISDGKEPTESDLRTMIEQSNYLLDEIEKEDDLEMWMKVNENKLNSLLGMAFVLAASTAEDEGNVPSDIKKDVKKLQHRFEKMQEKVNGQSKGQTESMPSQSASQQILDPSDEFLKLSADGYYNCQFNGETAVSYISIVPESGEGYFQNSKGEFYVLTIEKENSDRTKFTCSIYNNEGWPTEMEMKITISQDGESIDGTLYEEKGKAGTDFTGVLANNF